MAPVAPSSSSSNQKKKQDYSYMNQVMMPPPAVPMRQFPQQNSYMAYPGGNTSGFQNNNMGMGGYQYQQQQQQQQAPQVDSMTLNIDHPGTYAITLNYQPPFQPNPQDNMRQARQMFNNFFPRR